MFGEKALIGQSEAIIDSKGRIIIPAWSNREENESLGVIFDPNLSVYRIYNEENITNMFNIIKKKIDSSTSKTERIKYQKEELEFARNIIEYSKVDKQGRISISNIKGDNSSVKYIGAVDHLILELKK